MTMAMASVTPTFGDVPLDSSVLDKKPENICCSSYSLGKEWRDACYSAMGIPPPAADSSASALPRLESVVLVNLMHQQEEEKEESKEEEISSDPWIQTAIEINKNLTNMEVWIRDQKLDSVHLPADEASLIQSTATSFTATTANEIETLRSIIGGNEKSQQYQQHLHGIAQILLGRLQNLAQEFGDMQKQRHRPAVALWQDPLACPLRSLKTVDKRETNAMDLALGLQDDDEASTDQRFYPSRPLHTNPNASTIWEEQNRHNEWVQQSAGQTSSRPVSRFGGGGVKRQRNQTQPSDADDSSTASGGFSSSMKRSKESDRDEKPWRNAASNPASASSTQDHLEFLQQEEVETRVALEQESVLLQAKAENDLDAVQAMEQSMVDITTLLSQFSNLVSEQQQDVMEIHEATKDSKDNMEKGQEQLIAAKVSTEASKHWTAKGILLMTFIMLVFHWVRP